MELSTLGACCCCDPTLLRICDAADISAKVARAEPGNGIECKVTLPDSQERDPRCCGPRVASRVVSMDLWLACFLSSRISRRLLLACLPGQASRPLPLSGPGTMIVRKVYESGGARCYHPLRRRRRQGQLGWGTKCGPYLSARQTVWLCGYWSAVAGVLAREGLRPDAKPCVCE